MNYHNSFNIKLQQMLEDYLIELRHTINPNSIPVFTGLKHFCVSMNRKNIHWDIIHKLFPQKQKRTGYKPWTTKDIQNMLKHTRSIRSKALVHFLASTGSKNFIFFVCLNVNSYFLDHVIYNF